MIQHSTGMHPKRGFTLIELLVVIAVIAVLMGILMPALQRAREQGQRSACLGNLKNLTLAWIMYADDNDDKIVNGDSGEYGLTASNGPYWVQRDYVTTMTERAKIQAVMDGALYPYSKTVKVYKCPNVTRKAADYYNQMSPPVRTYAISDSMNCKGWSQMNTVPLKRRMQIRNAANRMVFVDDGGTAPSAMGGWTVYSNQWQWWDPPPVRHGEGTMFSFADGHSEYHKWEDKRTLTFGKYIPPRANVGEMQPNNPDLVWASLAVWGSEDTKLQ